METAEDLTARRRAHPTNPPWKSLPHEAAHKDVEKLTGKQKCRSAIKSTTNGKWKHRGRPRGKHIYMVVTGVGI